jgi:glycine/D-amino acid oxidase-like deaminating enzyme
VTSGRGGAGGDTFDVVIAGGAVMGSSVACHLAMDAGFSGRVLVVEPDPTYQRSASALSAGSIRQQFSSPVNIRISLYGIAFLREIARHLAHDDHAPEIGLTEGGYLYVAAGANAEILRENQKLQEALGADVIVFDRTNLATTFAWLNTGDIDVGTFGQSGEGWFDGYGLMQAFRAKARSLGVNYVQSSVMGIIVADDRVQSVQLDDGRRIDCGHFVNTAGASGARKLADHCGFRLPVYAKKRSVFSFRCPDALPRFPLLIDTSGVWARPEGDGYICGWSPSDDDEADHADDFTVDWHLFEDVIWPALAHRVPAFEQLRPGRAWAGHYDMCLLDHNAVVGRVPGLANAYLAAGFSGHGLQQSPAVGRGLAELIVHGGYRTLDLSDLGADRILTGQPLRERNVI